MHCIDEGKGSVLVLLHGFPLTHQMWKAQIDFFRKSHRVIAPDFSGFGRSAPTSAKTMTDLAAEVETLLEERGMQEPVTLAGFSFGGYVALPFYFKNPAKVSALVLTNSRAVGDTPDGAKGREKLAQEILSRGSVAAFEAMLPKIFAKSTPTQRPDIVEAVKHMALSCSKEGLATTLRGIAVREDFSPRLKDIKVPTLVITGDEDVISSPDEMKTLVKSVPKAKLEIIPGTGHMSPMENASEFNQRLAAFIR